VKSSFDIPASLLYDGCITWIGGINMINAILVVILIALILLFGFEMYHSLRRSNFINQLIRTYIHDLNNEQLIQEIYAYCRHDWKLRPIIQKHHASQDDIRQLYKTLLIWGNFQKGRRFVPISSFFFTTSLRYLLEHQDDDAKQLAMRMMDFFHI
jgi:hypothetical protein